MDFAINVIYGISIGVHLWHYMSMKKLEKECEQMRVKSDDLQNFKNDLTYRISVSKNKKDVMILKAYEHIRLLEDQAKDNEQQIRDLKEKLFLANNFHEHGQLR